MRDSVDTYKVSRLTLYNILKLYISLDFFLLVSHSCCRPVHTIHDGLHRYYTSFFFFFPLIFWNDIVRNLSATEKLTRAGLYSSLFFLSLCAAILYGTYILKKPLHGRKFLAIYKYPFDV